MDTPRPLVLSVSAEHASRFGDDARKSFDIDGGRIGRADDCDWTLRAAGVSRLHAVVRYVDDTYFLEDRSTNGMLLNGEPMRKGHPTPLKDGDCVHIDTFDVAVDLAADRTAPVPADPFVTAPFARTAPPFEPLPHDAEPGGNLEPLIPGGGHASIAGDGLDPLAFLGAAGSENDDALRGIVDNRWNHTPGATDLFRPPQAVERADASLLPENWDLTGTSAALPPAPPEPLVAAMPEPSPAMPPVAAPQPPVAATVAVPVTPAASLPTASPDLETLFHIAIDGLIDVLHARTELKNTFRLPVTVIRRSENNPLKFSPDARDAIAKLLSPPNAAFLTGQAALADAVDDIRYHQVAMLFGMRTAFHAMLDRFEPARFEPSTDAHRGFSPFRHKEHPWDTYRSQFRALTANADDCFQRLFGDVFAQAYEEQLARLKTSRAAGIA